MLDAKRKSPAVGRELGLAQKPARVVSDLPFMKRPGRGALYSVNVVEAPPRVPRKGLCLPGPSPIGLVTDAVSRGAHRLSRSIRGTWRASEVVAWLRFRRSFRGRRRDGLFLRDHGRLRNPRRVASLR